jgi:immune inhibitor A
VDFREVTPEWVDLTADLSAYAGQRIRLRWEYLTDQRTHGWGLAVDDLSAGGYSTDFAPADDWTDEGFHKVVDGKYAVTFPQYYLAENRQYRGYDTTLEHGPYSRTDDPDRVEHLPYQDGLLVWYANGYYTDNDTSAHPGGGANLPVDARPANQVWRDADGEPVGLANGRLQAFDATFDVDRTDGFAVAQAGRGSPTVRVRPTSGVPVFEDADPQAYLDDSGGPAGLRLSTAVAGAGTEIQVVSSDERTGRMVLKIGKRFVAATRAPHVLGQPRAGRALVAWSPDWFQSRVAERVQWLRDGQPIDGATRIVYRVRPSDVGHRLSVRFTGSKSGYRSTTTTSQPTARVEGPRPPRGHGHR